MSDYFYYTDLYARLFSEEENAKHTAVGHQYVEINCFDASGNTFILSDYIGKHEFVLLDFWASWCPPCMLAVPRLARIYEKFPREMLEIVGISLDENQNKWLTAIKENSMQWIQISDLKMWESQIAKLYAVDSIPTTILINREGKIVGRDLNIPEIENRLNSGKPKND